MSTHNIGTSEDLTNIIFQLSLYNFGEVILMSTNIIGFYEEKAILFFIIIK